jgi:hypothetical protein
MFNQKFLVALVLEFPAYFLLYKGVMTLTGWPPLFAFFVVVPAMIAYEVGEGVRKKI